MSHLHYLTFFEMDHETAITRMFQQLSGMGLFARRSFDLQAAKVVHKDILCPYHGDARCDCQIVVILVYGEQEAPITLVVHSRDGKTFISMLGEIVEGESNFYEMNLG